MVKPAPLIVIIISFLLLNALRKLAMATFNEFGTTTLSGQPISSSFSLLIISPLLSIKNWRIFVSLALSLVVASWLV